MTLDADGDQAPFDPEKLRRQSWGASLARRLLKDPRWLAAALRRLCPITRFGRYALVTRYDDVREVMTDDAVFGVPYKAKIEELAGANFMLGMDHGLPYQENAKFSMQAFRLSDVPAQARAAGDHARTIVTGAPGELDVMGDLVTPILAGICERYYGLSIDDRKMFALWSMAVSNYLFNPFPANADDHNQARAGATPLRATVDRAIAGGAAVVASETVLGRLLAARARPNDPPDDTVIRAIIVSLVTAIVPTGTLAAGNMLEMLLRRNDMMTAARQAAHAGDDDLLSGCLFEALRFMPVSLFWRRDAKRDFVLAADTPRAARLRQNTHVLASTFSAMFDPRQVRQPNRFDPTRTTSDYMLFGHGLHYCLGAAFAAAVIPAIIKPLLLCRTLERAPGRRGERAFFGIFPEHLYVTLRQ
jgi:cytochrome P450